MIMKLGLALLVLAAASADIAHTRPSNPSNIPNANRASALPGNSSFGLRGPFFSPEVNDKVTPATLVCLERKSDRQAICKPLREWRAVAAAIDAGKPDPKLIR